MAATNHCGTKPTALDCFRQPTLLGFRMRPNLTLHCWKWRHPLETSGQIGARFFWHCKTFFSSSCFHDCWRKQPTACEQSLFASWPMSEKIAIVNIPTLILPGIGNSDHAHWQTLWESANSEFVRVQQQDWKNPVCDEWVNGLEQAVAEIEDNPGLVAHSLGCLCVAHWAVRTSLTIKGALLVAPPNPEDAGFPSEARGFFPVPLRSIGFPSIVVASSNDPYGSLEFARACASGWGSSFVNIGPAGHINSASGLGEWQRVLRCIDN